MGNINLEEVDSAKWEAVAKNILEQEAILKICNYPAPMSILLTWKGDVYIGSIQKVTSDFSDEIVALSKSSCGLPYEMVNAIRKLDKERLELVAEDNLNLGGRQHILRRLDDKLVYMTSEQTKYIIENMPDICEI